MASSDHVQYQPFEPSQRVCKFWLAGTCLQGHKCRMLHPRAPAEPQARMPADEQLLEAVDWLEAVVVAAQVQGASVEALAEAHERVHGVAGHLVAMLSDGAKRTRAKRVREAPAKKRKGAPARGKLPLKRLPRRTGCAMPSGSHGPAAPTATSDEQAVSDVQGKQDESSDSGGIEQVASNPYLV